MHIRHPFAHEHVAIDALKQSVVDATYGGLWTSAPIPIGDTAWDRAWVAVHDGSVRGVGLSEADRLEDLWVAPDAQRLGIGSALLQACERDVASLGFSLVHLQVVSTNHSALRFYLRHGWRTEGEHLHPRFPITMVDMSKTLHV